MEGSIRQLPSGSWQLRYYAPTKDGKTAPRSKVIKAATKAEAQKELRAILRQLDTGTYVDPSKQTLSEYLDKRLTDLRALNRRPKTLQTYAGLVNTSVKPYIGSKALQKLTAQEIKSFYIKLATSGRKNGKGGLSGVTVHHIHRVLSEALKEAVRLDILPYNPCDKLRPSDMPAVVPATHQPLTDEQTTRLLVLTEGTPLYIPVLLAVATGMRRGEILGLRWQYVDLELGVIHVHEQLSATTGRLAFADLKTEKGKRPIPLAPPAVEALRRHKGAQASHRLQYGPAYQNHGLVVAQANGAPWHPDVITNTFREFILQTDLPRVRFHDLRHGHATQLIKRKIDPKTVSQRLGHSTIAITMDLYTHGDTEARQEAANSLTSLFPVPTEEGSQRVETG